MPLTDKEKNRKEIQRLKRWGYFYGFMLKFGLPSLFVIIIILFMSL